MLENKKKKKLHCNFCQNIFVLQPLYTYLCFTILYDSLIHSTQKNNKHISFILHKPKKKRLKYLLEKRQF